MRSTNLMGGPADSITLSVLPADSSVFESATFSPIATPFVIDDLHFGVPEPNTFCLLTLGITGPSLSRRRLQYPGENPVG